VDKMDIFGQNRTKWTYWDKSGQNGHIGTKVDKKDILGQNGHFGTFIPIYTHLYPFGTLPLDSHKKPPISLGH
jgi:hypothetical protein